MESKDAVHNGGLFSDTPLCGNAILCLPWAVMAWTFTAAFQKCGSFRLVLLLIFFLSCIREAKKASKTKTPPNEGVIRNALENNGLFVDFPQFVRLEGVALAAHVAKYVRVAA